MKDRAAEEEELDLPLTHSHPRERREGQERDLRNMRLVSKWIFFYAGSLWASKVFASVMFALCTMYVQ